MSWIVTPALMLHVMVSYKLDFAHLLSANTIHYTRLVWMIIFPLSINSHGSFQNWLLFIMATLCICTFPDLAYCFSWRNSVLSRHPKGHPELWAVCQRQQPSGMLNKGEDIETGKYCRTYDCHGTQTNNIIFWRACSAEMWHGCIYCDIVWYSEKKTLSR